MFWLFLCFCCCCWFRLFTIRKWKTKMYGERRCKWIVATVNLFHFMSYWTHEREPDEKRKWSRSHVSSCYLLTTIYSLEHKKHWHFIVSSIKFQNEYYSLSHTHTHTRRVVADHYAHWRAILLLRALARIRFILSSIIFIIACSDLCVHSTASQHHWHTYFLIESFSYRLWRNFRSRSVGRWQCASIVLLY